MHRKLTIIGYGTAGQDCLDAVLAEEKSVFTQVDIIEPNHEMLGGVDRKLEHKGVKCSFFSHVKACDSDFDVIFLSVPPSQMRSVINNILESSFSSFVIEKPGPLPILDRTEGIYKRILNLEDQVFICHQRQYAEHFLWVHEQIKKEAIGAVDNAVLTLGKWDYLTAGTHWMALCHFLFGTPSEAIGVSRYVGNLSKKYGYEIENEAIFTTRHDAGVTVQWRLGPTYGHRSDLRILGDNGYIDIKHKNGDLVRQCSLSGHKVYNNYGNPRYKLLEAAAQGKKPAVGCRFQDLDLYLRLFLALKSSPRP